jgi:glycosyltransferase involved in cell wall biosynthesis
MRIVYVTPFYPPHLGGLEKVAEHIAEGMAAEGHDVTVLTSAQPENGIGRLHKNLTLHRLQTFKNMRRPLMLSLLPKLLKQKDADLFHVHVAQAYVPEMVCIASKVLHKPYIAHLHTDLSPSTWMGFLLKIYKPLVLGPLLRNADRVIVFNEDQKAAVHERYNVPLTSIQIIPNGVESKFYNHRLRTIHKPPRLLFVGRLGVEKNIQQLLHALEGISDRFETHIVGEGDFGASLQRIARELELQNIIFHGRADGAVLLDFYRKADVFVITSEHEGMPVAVLEAMAMGLPIIGTDAPGVRNLVDNNKTGLLVPLYGNKQLREALQEIISDQNLYRRMNHEAFKKAEAYSWDRILSKLVQLYNEILA